jgi:hypothetical protein
MKFFGINSGFAWWRMRLHCSWRWIKKDFAAEFHRLAATGAFEYGGPSSVIWQTRNKFVLKVALESGFAVYKSFFQIRNFHQYLLRPSLSAAEAFNYRRLAGLGFPLPELLAVGETRCCFVLKNSFLLTRFVEGFSSGLDFREGGAHFGEKELLMDFCHGHLRLLAKLHDAWICHRGFTLPNLLYRIDPDGLKLCWVDVAECRIAIMSTRRIAEDMANFFIDLDMLPEERRELIKYYLGVSKRRWTSEQRLFDTLEKILAERSKK